MADDSTDAVRDLINALEGADVTDEMIEWIRQVCTPEALVIDSMVKEFVEAFNTAQEDYCNSILKALLMLHDGAEDLVQPQFKANTKFIPGLIKYLKKTTIEKLEGSSFILLTKLFYPVHHKDLVDEEFIGKLFDSLSFVKSEKVINDTVLILLKLSEQYESVSDNQVLDVCENHKNLRLFSEVLAQLVAKSKFKDDMSPYVFIKDYHGSRDKPLFYKNDMHVLIDVLLEQAIETVGVKGTGLTVLECLESLVSTPEYQKEKYKQTEFVSLLKQFKSMGSLGTIRKDNFDQFKKVVEIVEQQDE